MKSIFKKLYFFNFDLLPKYSNDQKRIQRLLLINYFFVFAVPVIIVNDLILALTGDQAYTLEKYPVLIYWVICLFALYLTKKKSFFTSKLITAFASIGFVSSYALTGYIIGEHYLWQPIMLMGISIIPFLIFDFNKEKGWLIIAFIICLLYIIFHNKIMLFGSDEDYARVFIRLNTTPFIYATVKILIFLFLTFIVYYSIRLNDHQQVINEQINKSLTLTGEYLGNVNSELQAHRNAINNSASLLIANDQQSIESVNDIFLVDSGYSQEDLTGKPLFDILLDYYDNSLYETILQKLLSQNTWRGDLKLKQKNGDHFWMQTAISAIYNQEKEQKGYLVIMFSITDLKQHEERLEKLNHEKDRILYAVAHDLKKPLMNFKTLVDLIHAGHIKQEEQEEIFGLMSRDCDHSTNLITELLEIGRLEDENYVLTKNKVDLAVFVKKSIERFEQEATSKKIKLVSSFDESITSANINENEFVRVIYNLMTNSIKFTPRGGEISVKTKAMDNNSISIKISDTGIGISKDLIPVIFDKFSKAGRAGINGEKSTGLGMWIVKHIIRLHGGNISVKSQEMKGTTFTIQLPE